MKIGRLLLGSRSQTKFSQPSVIIRLHENTLTHVEKGGGKKMKRERAVAGAATPSEMTAR